MLCFHIIVYCFVTEGMRKWYDKIHTGCRSNMLNFSCIHIKHNFMKCFSFAENRLSRWLRWLMQVLSFFCLSLYLYKVPLSISGKICKKNHAFNKYFKTLVSLDHKKLKEERLLFLVCLLPNPFHVLLVFFFFFFISRISFYVKQGVILKAV